MAKPPKDTKREDAEVLEPHPDAWERFEGAVDVLAKSPPKHKAAEKKGASRSRSPASKRQAKRGTGGGSK